MEIALVAIAAMLLLIALEIPIAAAMALPGIVGFAWIVGWEPTLYMIGETTFGTLNGYALSVIPLFILMGNLISAAEISRELYDAAHRFVGHLRGGLAIATVIACAAFAAVSGSSLATSAAMSKVAYPSMKRFGYSDALAAGSIASAGTLGIMIPPSVAFMVYGIMTQTDIGQLFIAGILPGLLGLLLYIGAVMLATALNPQAGPPGERSGWPARLGALKGVWTVLALFALVVGGMYGGVFTPTEAAGIGASGALAIAIARRRLTWRLLLSILRETAATTAMLFFILVGALIFTRFINLAGFTQALSELIQGAEISRMQLILLICLMYIVLGCFLESMSMVLLTLPIVFPVISAAGFDPVWFGVLMITLIEIALITPPVGMNVYMMSTLLPQVPLRTIFSGVAPFVAADVVRVALLIAFPAIAVWLPSLM
jgi:tripartite ATP-independent transporter DctM subunit